MSESTLIILRESLLSRERILIVGDIGTGKTRALFDLAELAIANNHKVFFFSLDDGHQRFLPRMKDHIGSKFFTYNCTCWAEMRAAYKESKNLWEKGDWVMMDRLDLAWDYIQRFYKAEKYGVSEDELSGFTLDRRLELLTQADELEKKGDVRSARSIRNAVNMDGPIEMDWDLLKSAMGSVTYEVASGRDAIQYGINYAATTWGVAGIQARMSVGENKSETDASKNDPRKLRLFNITIQGEKHVPGYFDTVLVFKKLPQGYVMSTEKDRERKAFNDELISGGFADTYSALVGVDIFGGG